MRCITCGGMGSNLGPRFWLAGTEVHRPRSIVVNHLVDLDGDATMPSLRAAASHR